MLRVDDIAMDADNMCTETKGANVSCKRQGFCRANLWGANTVKAMQIGIFDGVWVDRNEMFYACARKHNRLGRSSAAGTNDQDP